MAKKPEHAKAETGHNSGEYPETQTITEGLYHAANRKMDWFEQKAKELNAARGRFRKDLKARGVKLKTLDAVRVLRDMEPDEVKADLAERLKYMRWSQLPIGKQSELFPKDAETPSSNAAFADGFRAGVAGGDRKPPDQFMAMNQDWLKGYDTGQAKTIMDVFDTKDYFVADDGEEAEGGPGAQEEGEEAEEAEGEKVVSLADKRADKAAEKTKPPGAPKPKTESSTKAPETKAKSNDSTGKKPATKSAQKPDKKPAKPADKPKPKTKAEEAKANGGVKGAAVAGARKGGGDFEDQEPVTSPAAAAAKSKPLHDDDFDDEDFGGEEEETVDAEGDEFD